MKYWLLTTEYPPFHGGGISTYCRETARLFCEMGVEVTVFVPDDSVHDHRVVINGEGIRIIRFNSNRNGSGSYLGYTARLSYEFASIVRFRIAEEGGPDIIEAQDYLGIACYLLQFKYFLYDDVKDIPILLTLHSPAFLYLEHNRAPVYKFPDFWTGEMEKQAILMADHLISPSQYMAGLIRETVRPDDLNMDILPNPFQVQAKPVPEITRNKIVYFGKLSPQKGSLSMLSYFSSCWDEGFAHPLHIIGGTDIVYHPEGLTMGQLVARDYGAYIKKGLLIMHGKITPSSLASELQDAHMIVFPSIIDNLPYAVVEAMSLGKVVLASMQGGQREMIDHGINGFLFDHDLPDDFREKLMEILSLTNEEIRTIGMAAMAKCAEMYDPVTIGTAKMQLVAEVIRRPKGKARFPFMHQEPTWKVLGGELSGTLSVVIPYYNMGAYISQAVRSVRASSYRDIEILIIDDGSSEAESIGALAPWEGVDGITIYRNKNQGLAETRNFGARKAKGRFLAFLDADDKVEPNYYERAICILHRYENVFFAGSWVSYFGSSDRRWATFIPQPPYVLAHNPVNSSGLVYKRSAFLDAGLNDKRVDYGLEDYESVVSMMAKGYNGVAIPEFLFQYRVRAGSMSRGITRAKLLYSYKYISEKHFLYYSKFSVEIINILNANGPGILFDNPSMEVKVSVVPENSNRLMISLKSLIKRNRFLKRLALKLIKK